MTAPILLTDEQMQRFIAHGFLCLGTTLPPSYHRQVYERFDGLIGGDANLNPGNNLLPACPEIGAVMEDPIVIGALTSVLGPDYVMHPHRALHNNVPGSPPQVLHKDSYWGYRGRVRNHRARWAMVMYVPQATPLEQGPTGVVPGSQYQTRRPDEASQPEVAGALEQGGFLLIHYDVWHRKMKNLTQHKRFMMKFEFVRMTEPAAPTWNHADPEWRLTDTPALDMSAVWRRQWNWLRHAEAEKVPVQPGLDVAAGLGSHDRETVLTTLNAMARDGDAVAAHLESLFGLLAHPFDPVSTDTAYVIAAAGQSAVAGLLGVVLANDGEHVDETNIAEQTLDYIPNRERIARAATYGLIEIGAPAIPALLEMLAAGRSQTRKLAAYALGEIGVCTEDVAQALCAAARDDALAVRVNAAESLAMMQPTPSVVAALTAAVRDAEAEMRFTAALSLARLGPSAETAVPALGEALRDSNRYVPGYAVEALERIGTREATRALMPFLKQARWCAHTSPASIF